MKILLVAIPNHHFFQWTNQLKESGYEVYWFDITDGAGFVEKINWVQQFNGWKLKWNYPFRYKIKIHIPKLHSLLEKVTVNTTENVFEDIIKQIQPDVVHCFEMQLAGLPILSIMNCNKIPFVYSSWGSDMYYYKNLGMTDIMVKSFLDRVDYLITDCKRDYTIAIQNGYKNSFLGVFPGNGGINFIKEYINPINSRNKILIKGYESFGCKASKIIEAIELLPLELFRNLEFVIYSSDLVISNKIEKSLFFKSQKVKIYLRNHFISNDDMLKMMGKSLLHISNNISDGMPNTLLEAMGMGSFPIQSNPGHATEEVIQNGVNGYLISNPFDSLEIAKSIQKAINDKELRTLAQTFNVEIIRKNYDRQNLQKEIIRLYNGILHQKEIK